MSLPIIKYSISDIVEIDGFGGLHLLDVLSDDFIASGYEEGDLVKVDISGREIIIPVVKDFNYLDYDCSGLTLANMDANYLKLINFGEPFAMKYNLVERDPIGPRPYRFKQGVVLPINITISLYKKGGYKQDLKIFSFDRTNNKSDYQKLTTLEYSNFREVNYKPLKPHTLYRGSSPIDPKLGRDKYIDDEIEKLGINTIINFTNREEKAKSLANYEYTNYSRRNVLFEPLPIFFYDKHFTDKILNTIRFMLAHKPPYYVHCWEGKDRTGYFVMLLECLVGVNYSDIVNDYFLSFYNFFKVLPGSISYAPITLRVDKMMKRTFKVEEIDKTKLSLYAYSYFINIGLDKTEVEQLISLLKR